VIEPNRLKTTLRAGKTAVGTMIVEIRQPAILQVLANADFDFVLIDTEHGPFSIETVADLSRTARLHGVTPIVRVPDLSYTAVTQPLDAGAQGIMAPRIVHRDQVADLVQTAKYPPVGRRGSVTGRGHTSFRTGPVSDAMDAMNRETVIIIQIETREAVERIDSLLSVRGVDIALVGPNDLSIALGTPGALDDPGFIRTVEHTIERCRHHHVVPAIHVNEIALACRWSAAGMQMISVGSEIMMMAATAHTILTSLTPVSRR
jgi:2-keto-3-deoxy-L-rhamnonate aldolase RhmA